MENSISPLSLFSQVLLVNEKYPTHRYTKKDVYLHSSNLITSRLLLKYFKIDFNMTRMAISAMFLLCLQGAFGQTQVKGTLEQNTRWTIDNSPYFLDSALFVPDGITLEIDAGVVINGRYVEEVRHNHIQIVEFDIYSSIIVEGALRMNGQQADSIYMEKSGLRFKNTELNNSSLGFVSFGKQTNIHFGIEPHTGNFGELRFINCSFKSKSYIYDYVRDGGKDLWFENCRMDGTHLSLHSQNGVTLAHSEVENATILLGSIVANDLYLKNSLIHTSSNLSIDSSFIVNSSLKNSALLKITNSHLIANQFETVGSLKLYNSIFDGNAGQFSGPQVRYIPERGSVNSIDYCTFLDNQTGLTFLSETVSSSFTNNNFINNDRALFWGSNAELDADGNYWHSIDLDEIDRNIQSWNAGNVKFSNFLAAPTRPIPMSTPRNVFKTKVNNDVFLGWQQNTEENLTGYRIYGRADSTSSFLLIEEIPVQTSINLTDYDTAYQFSITAINDLANNTDDLRNGNESFFSEPALSLFENMTVQPLESSSLCRDSITAWLNASYYLKDNRFVLQLSDQSGSFHNPIHLDTIQDSNFPFASILPDSLLFGNAYSVRVWSSALDVSSDTFEIVPSDNVTAKIKFEQISDLFDPKNACIETTTYISYNGNGPANSSFSWNLDSPSTIFNPEALTGPGPISVRWDTAGPKYISLTVEHGACVSELNVDTVQVYETPDIRLEPSYVESHFCAPFEVSFNGSGYDSLYLDVNNGTGIKWANPTIEQGSSDNSFKISFDTLSFDASWYLDLYAFNRGCYTLARANLWLSEALQDYPRIEKISINPETDVTELTWIAIPEIDQYGVYRESEGDFKLVEYTDQLAYSSFDNTAFRYSITAINSDGCESFLSEAHKRVNLAVSKVSEDSLQLSWTSYEGFAYIESYKVYKSQDGKNFSIIAEKNSAGSTLSVPVSETLEFYRIGVFHSLQGPPESISNTVSTLDLLSVDGKEVLFSVYPNPGTKVLVPIPVNVSGRYELLSLTGRKISEGRITSGLLSIDLSPLPTGVYLLVMESSVGNFTRRIVRP